MNKKSLIVVVNGTDIIEELQRDYRFAVTTWGADCFKIRNSYMMKTSRSEKKGVEYEYTNWYKRNPDGGLTIHGKEEPDYQKLYPPEPEPVIKFPYWTYADRDYAPSEHLILTEKDYKENESMFSKCLVFRLTDCINVEDRLYKDPKALLVNSVIPERAADETRKDRK